LNEPASITAQPEALQSAQHDAAAEPRPIPPLPSDCCDSGCEVCVHDLYAQDLERWRAAQRAAGGGS
jgi:hypothetical protein